MKIFFKFYIPDPETGEDVFVSEDFFEIDIEPHQFYEKIYGPIGPEINYGASDMDQNLKN